MDKILKPARWHITDTFAVPVEVLYVDEDRKTARVHSRDRFLDVSLDELTIEEKTS